MTQRQEARADAPGQGQDVENSPWPWVMVTGTVAWNLSELRATVSPVAYSDDSSLHAQMVRFATAQLRFGRDPLTSWFPYLGLGSPQFLHYQSTPALLTGLAGLVTGPDAAFRWSIYLLWCLWPAAIYCSARLFGLGRLAAALAAVVAPLLHSVPGIGYEQSAYLWAGYGVWTQLWASWTLPFAWALSWRATAERRFIGPAAALTALTAALHFETGYLAFSAVVIMPFLIRRDLGARLVRAMTVLVVALLASAWVTVPLLLSARWTAINQALTGTPMANGYGARTELSWLATGGVFDDGHAPVISLLVAAGVVAAMLRWRLAGPERALAALFAAGLVLSFGRTSFGSAISVVPGSADLFFRRFLMGAQLAGIYLAGAGAAEVVRLGTRFKTSVRWWPASMPDAALAGAALAGGLVAYLYPAWGYLDSYAAVNAADIQFQQLAQAGEPQFAAAAAVIREHGPGRVYAGSPGGWGQYFTAGLVPVYTYLADLDLDVVGDTLRTASLMTQPEYRFDEDNPGDYPLFGIRYLVLPSAKTPQPVPPGAVPILQDSVVRVFELPGSSYIRVADTVGTVAADRADTGTRAVPYLRSPLPGEGRYLTVAFAGARAAAPTLSADPGPPGSVTAQHADLAAGDASATVSLHRRAVVVLSASFDPGWSVSVDGQPSPVEMVSPALVAVTVPAGTHQVVFRYQGFGGYPWLAALAVAALLAAHAPLVRRERGGTS